MLAHLTLPALALLIGFPGFHRTPQPKPTAMDSLPLPWKSASRLALENQFVLSGLPPLGGPNARMRITPDPRQLRVAMDPDSGTYSAGAQLGDVRLGTSFQQPLSFFSRDLARRSFERQWQDRNRQSINSLGANTPANTARQGLSFKFPSPLPKRAQSWLGPGGPALNVSGSESIRLSGTSNWTNQQVGFLGQRRSLFPSLDMQQDLDIRLEGQLSDRIKVNLLQNSANQLPLANRIAINYRGDEDDFLQALDLGNTNLSLPGTQYVSYSGRNEGLFGVKASTRVGPLDFTLLASKQEGKSERASYAGGASRQSQTISSSEYVKGVYYFLYDPNFATFDIPDSSIRIYRDDAIYSNDVNAVRGRALMDPTRRGGSPGVMGLPYPPGSEIDTASVRGSFTLLQPGADRDYEILPNIYNNVYKVIRLKNQLGDDWRLGATYSVRPVDPATGLGVGAFLNIGGVIENDTDGVPALTMKLLRAQRGLIPKNPDPNIEVYDTTSVFYLSRNLELRNFYQMSGFRIDPKSFQMAVRRGSDDPPRLFVTRGTTTIPYIELLGLDNYDESAGRAAPGHDGVIDGTGLTSQTRLFVDYENGVLFFPDLRPFAPHLSGRSDTQFEQFISTLLSRRDSLVGPSGQDNEANPEIYDKYTVRREQDSRYFIEVEFSAARSGGEISLGHTNIVQGSDAVTINSQRLVRDQDYTIDYDLGRIELKRQLGAADQLNIDYSYAPLFQQAGRTLIGSAFRLEGRDRSLGGAFMYESKGAQDLRPRLGEEPSRTLITDLNTEWRFKPSFLTRLADRLPGVRTTTPSEFNIQAEAGMSFPNPNTRNEVFIDDMEGVRDAVSLSMGPERWRWSSVPSRPTNVNQGHVGSSSLFTTLPNYTDAEVHWYSPPSAVHEIDLRPTLSEAQGSRNSRQVLAISVPRRPTTEPAADTMWVGLTYPLDPVGLDLSRSQFIELWVNDFNDHHKDAATFEARMRGLGVKLHVDLGVVSEDMMRAPNKPPNNRLDTEDKPPRDNSLTVTDANDEDTGYDGLKTIQEPPSPASDLATADSNAVNPGYDPEGDDFKSPDNSIRNELDPRRYKYTNGPEGNKAVYPFPDTEDLNLNSNLDTQENYFEYTIDLGDAASPFLVTDVLRDFPGFPVADSTNGWRRYRIPIADAARLQFGTPDLTLARHVRFWVEGMQLPDPTPPAGLTDAQQREYLVRPMLMLGGLEIVGNRWQQVDLTQAERDTGTTLTLNTVNSVDNSENYVPPFDPGETRSGSQGLTRREQSISMEFENLYPGHTLEAYKTFSIDENYSRYGALNWYAAAFDVPDYIAGVDSLDYFVRFASDERGLNYYEVKRPLPRSSAARAIDWENVRVEITDLSNLKLRPDFPLVDPIDYRVAFGDAGDSLIVHGRPSFTRLRRISFGLANSSARSFRSGQLWFNEIRALDVAKDRGLANRTQVNGRIANLLSYNASWNSRDADFLSVGESRGLGSRTDQIAYSGTFETHRFFEGTGIVLPVNYSHTLNSNKPRFTAGDDVVRTGELADASETRSTSSVVSTQYSRNWSERSNPILRYTIGGVTANISRSQSFSSTPTSKDSTTSTNAAVNYSIAPRKLLSVGLPIQKARLYLLPERFYWNYNVATNERRSYSRIRPGSDSLLLQSDVKGRTAALDFGGDNRPVDLFHHHFEGRRNLTPDPAVAQPQTLGFLNFGKLSSWRQSFDTRYQVTANPWLKPALSWNSNYNQQNDERSKDYAEHLISNGQGITLNWDFPFDRLAGPPAPPTYASTPRDTAHKDSTRVRTGFDMRRQVRSLLSRLGPVSTDASFNKSSSFTRVTGTPSMLYMFGLTSEPGISDTTGRVVPLFQNQSGQAVDWRTSARTRILLGRGASLQTRAEYTWRQTQANGVENVTSTSRYPDFDVDYGQVTKAIRLDRFLTNPRLRTAYSQSRQVDYQNGGLKSGVAASSQWSPLVGISGDFKNGTRAEFRFERRVTRRDNLLLTSSRTTDRNTDLNLSLNRSYSQGQKVNILGRETTVRSNVTLGLTGAYSRRKGETILLDFQSLPPSNAIDTDRISLNGTGSYSFSSNVTGNVALGFGQDRDLQKAIVRRNLRVELRAQFTF